MEKEYNEIPKGDHICDDGIDNLNHSEWTWKIVIDNDLKVWYPYKRKWIDDKDYNAQIKWLDSGDIRDVIITTKEVGEDDDQIFFYFESESEIKEYMKEGKNEFIILEYSEFN